MLDTSGGTTIDKAVESIEKRGINSLVITDAEDRCRIYSDKAFFIGVNGARFTHFNGEVISEYSDKNQVVVFDGTKIFGVDKQGRTIH
jgi:hypothetical protein